ncbi:energy transducer TonB [Sphingomonas sp. 1P06PA]|uniref:energy transducer TonB n=1 Tax=Sphingomonas sp. 1P06PA TaxID=554121 RepID=UPI0039A53453
MALAMLLLSTLSLQTGDAPKGAPPVPDRPSEQTVRNAQFMLDHYPPAALKRREQGKVGVRVSMSRDGRMNSCEPIESSGFWRLDRETCDMLVRFGRFTPKRNARGNPVASTQEGYVDWRLPAGITPAIPAADRRELALDKEKLVCKPAPKLGSLFITQKRCLTVNEWRLAEIEAKRITASLQNGLPPGLQ